MGTRNPGSSALRNPPHPKSPCVGEERRAGLGQTLSTGSPIVGSRVSHVQGDATNIVTSLEDTYVSNAVSLCSPTTSFTLRGRDECPSSEGRTQPRNAASSLHRDLMELVVSIQTTEWSTGYGVGGLLKKNPPSLLRLPGEFELDLRYLWTCMMVPTRMVFSPTAWWPLLWTPSCWRESGSMAS